MASPVCVTGANGFIASIVVKQLLEKGYAVHGTVRDPSKTERVKHLLALENAKDNLTLFAASLTGDTVREDFKKAIEGCEVVIHTASPYIIDVKDPQRDLVDPALSGVENVFQACADCGVRKIVLTSSVAAITDSPDNDHVYTEEDWNTTSSLDRNPYYYSKTLAEKRAWELSAELGINLVVVNPFAVVGPSLTDSLNPSNAIFANILSAEWPVRMAIGFGFVDVRDVATAHVLAMEKEEAAGRYIVWNETKTMVEVCDYLSKVYPQFPIPQKDMTSGLKSLIIYYSSYLQPKGVGTYLRTNLGRYPKLDNSKVKKLGLEFTPIEQTMKDTCEDIIAKGQHVKKKKKGGNKLVPLVLFAAAPIVLYGLYRLVFA